MKTRWKFLREGMKSEHGDCVWKNGEWKHYDSILEMCHAGFHCSKKINQAFGFVKGEILAKVEVKGENNSQTDKEVWSDMRVVRAWKWQKKDSVALSVYAAELCLDNFEKMYPEDKRPRLAIDAAKQWMKNPNEGTARAADSAAYSAADSAAASAADSAAANAARAAYSAADSAAYSAADSAAASAARAAYSAAYSAARAALTDKIEAWMQKRVKKLEEIK